MARRGRGKNRHHNSNGRQDQGQQRQEQRQPGGHNQRLPQSQDSGRPRQDRPQPGKTSFTSITQPRRQVSRPAGESAVAPLRTNRTYKVAFFDTISQAKADIENLKTLSASCDQLNIVVRAEASMDDAELNSVGKLFCGAAWALIHERRRDDGWYDTTHE